jgi:hypothetical protein
MKFDSFINILEKRVNAKKEWNTLSNKIPFSVDHFDGDSLHLILTKKTERRISIEEFEKVWNISKTIPVEERFTVSSYSKHTTSQNLSYILGIMERTIWD